jgi:hypothetical protein
MFKKSAILLAVSSLTMAAQADVLSAGKDTKFEVNVDLGAYYQTIKGGVTNETTNAVSNAKDFKGAALNQIEIKASHKVSDDITVFGEIEIDYDPIIDNDTPKTDDVRLGFASKSVGRFSVGQFDNAFEDGVMEALIINRGDSATISELKSGTDKGRNVQYSHKLGDLSFALDYTFSPSSDKTEMSNSTAVSASYVMGDFSIAAGMAQFGDYTGGAASKLDSATGLALAYKMGSTKLSALYAKNEDLKGLVTQNTGLALTYTMGAFGAGINMQTVDKDGSAKRTETGLTLGYMPFKGMEFFVDMVKLDNTAGKGDTTEVGVKYSF